MSAKQKYLESKRKEVRMLEADSPGKGKESEYGDKELELEFDEPTGRWVCVNREGVEKRLKLEAE